MPRLKLRRLFDIKTDHVSLVDKAANLRQFILMKRKEGESGMEIVEVLQKVKNSLNDLSSRIEELEGGILTFDTTEIEKKGAKFSKETIASLRSLRASLDKILGESEEDDVSKEDIIKAVTKGIQESLKVKEEKKTDEDLGVVIAKVITDALKSIKE